MANYYYVKDINGVDTGTASGGTGRYAMQQVGTFAGLGVAGYYPSIPAAIADVTPVAGDFIMVSDLHDYVLNAGISYAGAPIGVTIVAVDDTDIAASRRAGNYATETVTSSNNAVIIGSTSTSGIRAASNVGITFYSAGEFRDGVLKVNTSNDNCVNINSGGHVAIVENTTFNFNVAGGDMILINAGAIFHGANITTLGAGSSVVSNNFQNGGGTLTLRDSDISSLTGTLFNAVGGHQTNDDTIRIHLDNCKIATGAAFTSEKFASPLQRALFTRCSDSTTAAEYQYHLHTFGGDVWDDTSIHRNQDTPFTLSNQIISYEITTNSDASLGFPLWIDYPMTQYVPLSTTSTLTFYITCTAALTDKDIYVSVGYIDATNHNETHTVISAPETVGGSLDLLAAGLPLATDDTGSTWVGQLANIYKIVIDCPNGADCQPTVTINVTKPSTVIYIASEYGIS